MKKITIRKSETADTRSCDYTKVTKEQLLKSSEQHVGDIRKGFDFFKELIDEQVKHHDHDKFSDIDGFHRDFVGGFKNTTWWDNHRKVNRHHLTAEDGIPEDIHLIDILDFIVDGVMAGKARTGVVYPFVISDTLLRTAFENTVSLLYNAVEVDDEK
jgi:hypothetical protein